MYQGVASAPSLHIGLNNPYAPLMNVTTSILGRCFGAQQAMTCGHVLGARTLTSRNFCIFGAAMVPYILGLLSGLELRNRGPGTNPLWLNVLGYVFFFGGSLLAGRLLQSVEEEEEKVLKKKEEVMVLKKKE
ncbi:hypothetical protein V8F06_010191 [Rhypophila decipiens]